MTRISLISRDRLITLLVVFVLLGSGCATSNISGEYEMSGDNAKAILVGSFTVIVKEGSIPPAQQLRSVSFYYSDRGKTHGRVEIDASLLSLNFLGASWTAGGDFEDLSGKGKGRLAVLELPAGSYEFDDFNISISGARFRPTNKPSIRFHLVGGAINYIGEVALMVGTGKNVFGMDVLGTAEMQTRDSRSRDIPMLKVKYPKLAHHEVRYELATAAKPPSASRLNIENQPVLTPKH